MKTVAPYFGDYDQAIDYLQVIRKRLPRYMQDQLQMIVKAIQNEKQRRLTRRYTSVLNESFIVVQSLSMPFST